MKIIINFRKYFFVFCLIIVSQSLFAKNAVHIGVIFDGHNKNQQQLIVKLKRELTLLLGSRYTINLTSKAILSSNWSSQLSEENYLKLAENRDVDIIIVAGIISSAVIVKQKYFKKPVIAIGIVAPLQQKLALTKRGTSGENNLSYVLFNRSITRDLDEFYRVFPYEKIGIVASEHLMKALALNADSKSNQVIHEITDKKSAQQILLPVSTSISEVINNLKDVDAVYLGYMGQHEGKAKDELISYLNEKKIPTFGFSNADINRGVLAASAPKQPLDKLTRHLALNIESILNGKNASKLPVHLSFDEKLTLNMKTARQIGYSPRFSLLSEVNLVNNYSTSILDVLTLSKAVNDALRANLDLKIETDKVKLAEFDIDLAESSHYPSLTLNATGTQIDQDRAASSFGKQAERTTSGTLKLEQLIYSEGISGNVDIKKHLLTASQQGYEQQKLDIILNTTTTYFDILRAQTVRNIQLENVTITKKNLNIAKQREAVGYSGRSDVFYWESQLATAQSEYFSSINQYKLSLIQLNLLLNNRLDKKFIPEKVSLSNGVYANYLKDLIKKYVDTPLALEKFTTFLVAESMSSSPEVAQIQASIRAQKRRHLSARKKRYLPNVSLIAESQYIYSRGGAGTNVAGVDPDDNSWTASLNFSWPLYEGGAISIERQQAFAEIMQLKDQLVQLRQSLELNIRAALLDLVTKTVNLKSSRRSAEFASKSLRLVQDAYTQGKASFVELSDAQKNSLVSEQKSLNSVYEYFSAVLKVERSVGKFSILSSEEEKEKYLKRLNMYFHSVADNGVN